ncbi:MAG: flagellar biosynthesis anti-sigma factor FlgM [Glaciecola sp.]
MSINNVNNTNKPQLDASKVAQQQVANQNSGSSNQAAASQASAAPVKQDSVSLTQSAQQLANVQKKGSEAPVNQEKVDRLKKAIAEGEYKVNPDVLAKKMSVMESQILGVKA